MRQPYVCAAVDLGAESGRVMLGRFDGGRVSVEEVHRFPNGPVRVRRSLYWDILRLFDEIKHGLRRAGQAAGGGVASVAIDTWGVDFGLLDRYQQLIGNPVCYRDERTEGMLDEALRYVTREEIFEQTGVQFLSINTLMQLMYLRYLRSPALSAADCFLMIPDLLNFWLSGLMSSEVTIASTTQFYNPRAGAWATPLLDRLGIPTKMLPYLGQPGRVLGPLLHAVADETGLGTIPVVSGASHDTAAAVAAVPTNRPDFAYISSGTWSLVGAETLEPVITPLSLKFNFTNEGGVAGTIRLLKNIMGLWLVQECRRFWAAHGDALSYDDLTRQAAASPAFGPLVDPDDEGFLAPGDMPGRLRQYCARTGQRPPTTTGEIVRCALESLALRYRWTLEHVEELVGQRLAVIHVVGGGSQNSLLCQMTADATGRPVIAGPVEATAIGNVLVQLMAAGEIGSLAEAREVVRRSVTLTPYEPQPDPAWDAAYARFLRLIP